MLWLSEQLADYAKKQSAPPRPLTLKEMNDILDRAEAEIAAGIGTPDEETWRKYDEEFAREEQESLEMAEAV